MEVNQLIEASKKCERAGDVAGSLDSACQAVEAARVLGNSIDRGQALVHLGRLHFHLGHYPLAESFAREALSLHGEENPASARSWMLLGSCASETNAVSAAEQYFHQASDLARQSGDDSTRMEALHNLAASVYMLRGQFELALAADEEALAIIERLSLTGMLPYPLMVMAWCYIILGRSEAVRASLADLYATVIPGSRDQGYYYWLSGDLALLEGNLSAALAEYTLGRSIAEASGDPGLNAVIRLGLSRYHRLMEQPAAAYTWADDALKHAERVGYCHLQGKSLIERGRAAWANLDLDGAERDFREALRVLAPLQAEFDLSVAALLLAGVCVASNQATADQAWLDAARRIQRGNYYFLLEQERGLVSPLISAGQSSSRSEIVECSAAVLRQMQRQPAVPLKIHTFGGLNVIRSGRRIPAKGFRQRRAGELLAYLLLAPQRSATIEQACEAIWPDQDPKSCQALFHQATSSLRRALEPDLPDKFPSHYLQVEDGLLALNLSSGSSVDFEDFSDLAKRRDWRAAAALYTGELLPEYLYTGWSAAARLRFAQVYQQGLLSLAEQSLGEGDFTQAMERCRDLLAIDPWQEQAVLIGMRACLAVEDLTGAVRLYQNLEKTLREELGLAPQKEIQSLYAAILSASPS